MKCWHCNAELIWGADHDISHEDDEYQMVTNLSCPNCESIVYVYLPKDMLEIEVVLDTPANNDNNTNNVVKFEPKK